MGTLVTLAIILAACAGLGALAGLVWGTVKFWRKAGPQFIREGKEEFREAYKKARGSHAEN